MDFDFDDDLFDGKKIKASKDINTMIVSYKPKLVQFDGFLDLEPQDSETKLEETANWLKLKADYYYFKFDYTLSLQNYQKSLDLSYKSPSLNNKIIQRELNESIARCFMNLNKLDEALCIATKLEETAQNFEAMSTSLDLRMEILKKSNGKHLDDELVTVEKLIVLHPLFINLWIRLADVIYLKINADSSAKIENEHNKNAFINHYSVCYLTISELIRHGYQFRSEIVSKQKHKQKLWLNDAELKMNNNDFNISMEKILSENFQNIINENLEQADKLEDNEKLMQAKNLINHEHFSKKFLSMITKFQL